jgi:hypothetical protein
MKKIIIPIFLLCLCLPCLSYRDIDLRGFTIEGDSVFKLKYRVRYVGDNGIVDSVVTEKYKGDGIRLVKTTAKDVKATLDSLNRAIDSLGR